MEEGETESTDRSSPSSNFDSNTSFGRQLVPEALVDHAGRQSERQSNPRSGASSDASSMSLSHLQWRATEWLLAFGPLSPAIVMDYFVMSPFFDRTSNNAVLRMQMQFSRGGMEGVDEEVELKCVPFGEGLE